MFAPRPIIVIARKEFRERLRSRWVLAVAAVLATFALAIAWFGAAQQGAVGFRGAGVTIASLVSLVIYLVPLIALLLGYDAIVGERERGSLDLLLALPLSRAELLLGKFLGLGTALAATIVAGFGLAGLVLGRQFGGAGLVAYGEFVLSTLLLGLAFLSLALLISTLAANRVVAGSLAIALWFLFVLVYDLVLLGLLVATEGGFLGAAFPLLLLLNPADVFRVLNVMSLDDVRTLYGLATVMPARLADPRLQGAVLALWIAVPLGAAWLHFRRAR
jgi:Cu-processing system permease protein